jgi:alanine racemase
MRKITIKDIAERAGVSPTSVSFAFNYPSRLSEETLERVLEVAEELGYVPNPLARSLATGRTGVLGVLVPQPITEIVRNPFFAELLEGIAEVCTSSGFSLLIVPPLEGSIVRAIGNAAADGFLTLGLELFKSTMVVLQKRGVPFVMVDSDPIDGIPAVNVDDEGGAYAAMKCVLGAGHRRIAILAIRSGKHGEYEQYVGTLRRRMKGYISALQEVGLNIDDVGVDLIECASTARGGRRGFNAIWRKRPHPTAVVAMSDIIGAGLVQAARQAGIRVPDELSVIGFDDIPLAELVSPGLTTVSQPIRRKGKMAAAMLVDHINGNASPHHRVLPTKLVVRETVGPAPRAKLGRRAS